ncbi:MAG: hypothetical protein HETSPECPRED_002657 [Heterodermia speciosa]|uniref:Uncharacterized protein n=1 Tax=Heterodermia speciosa TaxID=116794 RepID=A0A8H3PI65_9LECA|nr:MAG: hypothetical protein HETSPECPRED_002657 [Heterodermia speciosa]
MTLLLRLLSFCILPFHPCTASPFQRSPIIDLPSVFTNLTAGTPPIPLSAVLYSGPPSPPPAPHPLRITCFQTGRRTTVATCRPTLNVLKTFPFYRRIQNFQESRSPTVPDKPPLYVYVRSSDCALELASGRPDVVDRFSYEMVRQKATDLVEECQEYGGMGGWSPMGRGLGWYVKIIGYKEPDESSIKNGTVLIF